MCGAKQLFSVLPHSLTWGLELREILLFVVRWLPRRAKSDNVAQVLLNSPIKKKLQSVFTDHLDWALLDIYFDPFTTAYLRLSYDRFLHCLFAKICPLSHFCWLPLLAAHLTMREKTINGRVIYHCQKLSRTSVVAGEKAISHYGISLWIHCIYSSQFYFQSLLSGETVASEMLFVT